MNAAVLGSPISHSLSPLLHNTAYQILGIDGNYQAIEISENELLPFIERAASQNSEDRQFWSGLNLTMPLKETVFQSPYITFDARCTLIRSANTLLRDSEGFRATSTDLTAFMRLLEGANVERVAIIGGGGTARAAIGAIADRIEHLDLILRTPSRIDAFTVIAPAANIRGLPMDTSIEGYDLVINTTPSGVADNFASRLGQASGLYFESLYNPWPTELAFAWKELGGKVLNGVDLLVEQALDAIALMTESQFDYASMRQQLLSVATHALHTRNS